MSNTVIFDLDGTIIDTDCLLALRDKRDWVECKRQYHQTAVYPGIPELWAALKAREAKIAVFTKTPSNYAESILRHHSIPYDMLVAYHDVVKKKPDGEGVLKIIAKLQTEHCIGIGDDLKDVGSFQNGGIPGYCASWNAAHVQSPTWAAYLKHPSEVLTHLK